MAILNDKHNNFASREVEAAGQLLRALETWENLQREWDSLGLGTAISDTDLEGDNQHLTVAALAAGFTSYQTIETLMSAGHFTNMYALLP